MGDRIFREGCKIDAVYRCDVRYERGQHDEPHDVASLDSNTADTRTSASEMPRLGVSDRSYSCHRWKESDGGAQFLPQ